MACLRMCLVWMVVMAMGGVFVSGSEEKVSGIAMVTDAELENSLAEGRFHEIIGDSLRVHEFAKFAAEYGKVYKSIDELRQRFAVFIDNVDLIEETNARKLSYTLAVNKFADMTMSEFQQTHLFAEQECSAAKGNHKLRSSEMPLTKDWRHHGIVSPVKNQAPCGSCWTFSTTGALESAHAQTTGHMVLLSEQQLVDCASDFKNFGCNGGLPSQAFEYIRYSGGLSTEEAYPYTAKEGVCHFKTEDVGAKVYDVVNITSGAEDELKDAVAFVRPVSVAFESVKGFAHYSGGVFTSPLCRDSPETINHAVLAVGYDTDENGAPYWIMKNSWGADWGLQGYFYIEMGKNMCGVASCASYPVVPEDLLR